MEVAASRLEQVSLEGGPPRFWPIVAGAQKAVSIVQRASLTHMDGAREVKHRVSVLDTQMAILANQRAIAELRVAAIEGRLRLLALAVQRWQVACRQIANLQRNEVSAVEEVNTKRRGKKSKASEKANNLNEVCGFDIRLVWDDCHWDPWAASGELDREESLKDDNTDEQFICKTRGGCDRHAGWQRLHEASFHAEKAAQVRARNFASGRTRS